ncbi:glutamyl-tRNA reductase [Salinisphaera sp. SWV1]|uniref:glutamyl-tRNA reductase n=1 Tax=Salinisphaera sp. SWV1 TaxID=3454139 RepID=UPI003F876985
MKKQSTFVIEQDAGVSTLSVAPRLLVVGLSHRTASADIRGRLSFAGDETPAVIRHLASTDGVEECALLSTCNRTEVYALAEGRNAGIRLLERLAQWRDLNPADLRPYLYCHNGGESVRHLFRVASGLDSMVLGETQILGQLKRAFLLARESGTVQAALSRLSEHAVASAKRIRNRTGIGGCPVSLAGAATAQVQRAIDQPAHASVLVIGAGENAGLILRHLSSRGIGELWIANRTRAHAESLARQCGARVLTLDEIDAVLPRVDVVVSSTAADHVILDAKRVAGALDGCRNKGLLLLDLAVPHDIEPAAGQLPGVRLLSADDLGRLAREHIRTRREAAANAERIVDENVARYLQWLRGRASVPAIRALRERAERDRRDTLERAKRRLKNGMPAEEALDYLSRQLSGRLLHNPTRALAEANLEDASGETLRTVSRLLNVEDIH